jgi:hypothetical protein
MFIGAQLSQSKFSGCGTNAPLSPLKGRFAAPK